VIDGTLQLGLSNGTQHYHGAHGERDEESLQAFLVHLDKLNSDAHSLDVESPIPSLEAAGTTRENIIPQNASDSNMIALLCFTQYCTVM
jgi:hypothetical protein